MGVRGTREQTENVTTYTYITLVVVAIHSYTNTSSRETDEQEQWLTRPRHQVYGCVEGRDERV